MTCEPVKPFESHICAGSSNTLDFGLFKRRETTSNIRTSNILNRTDSWTDISDLREAIFNSFDVVFRVVIMGRIESGI